MGGGYNQVIEGLYNKYHIKESEVFNPCKISKIILADDEPLSNMLMRRMIEEGGKYQVFQFYNGVDVINKLITLE